MIPAVIAAKLANPLIKWGIVGGVALIGLFSLWLHGYHKGKGVERSHYEALLMEQSEDNAKKLAEAVKMTSAVTQDDIEKKREVKERIKYVNKEVIRYVEKTPSIPLDAELIRMYDTLLGVLNSTAVELPAPDVDAGTPEVPRGRLGTPAPGIVHLDTDQGEVHLTTEQLIQAVVDMSEKYALMKQSYKGATDWNEGREKIELERE